MQIERNLILTHLSRIFCDGLVGEASFAPDLAVEAKSADERVLVFSPGLPGEGLPEKTGIPSVANLRKMLSSSACEAEKIEIGHVSGDDGATRLEVIGQQEQKFSLICSSPRTIATNISQKLSKKAKAEVEKGIVAPLPRAIVDGVAEAIPITGAKKITFTVSGTKGRIKVGDRLGNFADFPFSIPKNKKTASATIEASIVASVFKQVHDYTQSKLVFIESGPVVVDIGDGYSYIMIQMLPDDEED